MRALGLLALMAPLAACSVPSLSLDGKQCPCIEAGYVCDTQTNRCLATNDAGEIIDSPSATSCLSTVGEHEVYRYTGTFDWQHADPTWRGAAEIEQSAKGAVDTYAFTTASMLAGVSNYHVISSMRQVKAANPPSLGIVLRAQAALTDKARYACTWLPKTRTLQLQSFGTNTAVLATSTVAGTDALPTTFTMEASVNGSMLSCCIREIAVGLINAVDPVKSVAAGYPGLTTSHLQAAFGSFVVLTSN